MVVTESPRLTFRRLSHRDLDDLAALYADPEVMRYFESTRTREQAREQIERSLRDYDEIGYSFWATVRRADKRFIGRCGLLAQTVEGHDVCEVAYMLARDCWGQGLGTEAARALTAHAFRTFGFARVVSIIDHGNIASQRVAEKCGMTYVKDIVFEGYPCRLYAVRR